MFARTRRLWEIWRTVRRYGLGELLPGRRLAWLLGSARDQEEPLAVRIRLALVALGPIFVKFGQAVSTRRDLLPPDMAVELAKLQDRVPPFAGDQAAAIVAAAYGQPLEGIFEFFDREPLAAASIAQVHAARLRPGPGQPQGWEVVVKVLRPGVHAAIRRDLDVMFLVARLASYLPEGARLRLVEVVAEYQRIVTNELDLVREGANASQLRRNWLGSDLIYHPVVDFDHTRENVLVMERITGIPINDIDALAAAGVNFRVLAERGVEIFFKQVFRDNFFHADMHPGNIFIDVSNPERPRYIGVDFGIVGALTPSDQRYLAENFLAFFNRDYRRIAQLHVDSGWMPADTRIEEFEGAIRTASEPIFNKPLAEISFGAFLIRLFQIARRFNYQVQPQLVLLEKTILNVEGLGRDLYPQLDLWTTAKPILEEWMRDRLSPRRSLAQLRENLPLLVESLPELIGALRRFAHPQGHSEGERQRQALAAMHSDLRRELRRLQLVVAGAGLLVCATLGAGLGAFPSWVNMALGGAGLGCWLLAWRRG